jgi:hypothetical protein
MLTLTIEIQHLLLLTDINLDSLLTVLSVRLVLLPYASTESIRFIGFNERRPLLNSAIKKVI